MKKILLNTILLLAILSSCTKKAEVKGIVVSTNIIANSLKEIIGDDEPIIVLMNSETDPHSYQASPKDFEALMNAKVIVFNGLHLEGKFQNVIKQITSKNRDIIHIEVADGLDAKEVIVENDLTPDPHIWFDVKQWSKCLNYSVNELIKIYPEHKNKWLERLQIYEEKLAKTHKKTLIEIKKIPEQSSVLITAHDAFSYFSRAYGIKIRPLQGRNTIAEPTIQDVIELSNFITENKIKSIFVETTVNKKFILSIQESCKNKGHLVTIGGELYSDALGRENTPEATYIGMIEHNVNTIVKALK